MLCGTGKCMWRWMNRCVTCKMKRCGTCKREIEACLHRWVCAGQTEGIFAWGTYKTCAVGFSLTNYKHGLEVDLPFNDYKWQMPVSTACNRHTEVPASAYKLDNFALPPMHAPCPGLRDRQHLALHKCTAILKHCTEIGSHIGKLQTAFEQKH